LKTRRRTASLHRTVANGEARCARRSQTQVWLKLRRHTQAIDSRGKDGEKIWCTESIARELTLICLRKFCTQDWVWENTLNGQLFTAQQKALASKMPEMATRLHAANDFPSNQLTKGLRISEKSCMIQYLDPQSRVLTQDAGCWNRNPDRGSRILNSGSRILNTGSNILDPASRVQDSASKMLNARIMIWDLRSRILHCIFKILNPGSGDQDHHPGSRSRTHPPGFWRRILYAEQWFQDPASWYCSLGSWVLVLGRWVKDLASKADYVPQTWTARQIRQNENI
jgi:hypothetical protein